MAYPCAMDLVGLSWPGNQFQALVASFPPVTNLRQLNPWVLDKPQSRSKIPEIPAKKLPLPMFPWGPSGFMTSKPPAPPSSREMKQSCKHPRVQIVSRDEDSEFVACKECGEIFESSEFKDMNIEEGTQESEI